MRILLALAAFFSLLLSGLAQETKITADDLATLLDFGFEDPEVLGVLKKPGQTIVITAADLPQLEKKGAGEALLAYLKTKLPAPAAPAGLSVAEVIALWSGSKDAKLVERRILETDSRFRLEIDDFLACSRARLPYRLIDLMKKRPAQRAPDAAGPSRPAADRLDLDDLVRLARDGSTDEAIVNRIRASKARFSVTTEDILRLEREGVSLAVLREVYARSEKKEAASEVEGPGEGELTARKTGATPPAASPSLPPLDLYSPKGGAFAMLAPRDFVTSERFTGRKMLVQMVDASAAEREDLPDLELSVLVGRTREREQEGLTAANLEPMADKLMKSVAAGFRRDGIVFVTRKPQALHLAGRPALRYPTSATTASGTGHVGASYVLFAGDQVLVISYSARQELSALWRDRLEICARSLTLREENIVLDESGTLAATDPVDALRRSFVVWRDSLRRFDYSSHARITPLATDRGADRLAFVERALALEESRNRLEFDRVDMKSGELHYKIFGIEGKTSAVLAIVDGPDGQPRLRAP